MLLTETRTAPRDMVKTMAIVLAVLAPFIIYVGTAQSIVSIWNSSETFAHGYIILPISLWLIWKRRDVLSRMSPTPYWPALLSLAVCGFGWLLAEMGDVQVVRQYAFAAMLPLTVVAVCGLRISWAIAFPLAYVLLAVPFGEVFIDPLINLTADFTVWAVQMTGIPVLRDGTNFSIPTGNWSVVEACSGVRYLIASFTLGCLYAYLTYRSRKRQMLFILAAILVPIVANGLRAYMIVMIGHLSGMALATGVDHIIYGWLFFGLVMFLMFWVGGRWREDVSAADVADAAAVRQDGSAPASSAQVAAAAVAVIACLAFWPLYASFSLRANASDTAPSLQAFKPSWNAAQPFTSWTPQLNKAAATLNQTLEKDGERVGLSMRYYRNQTQGAGLISSTNQLVGDTEDDPWRRTGSSGRIEQIGERQLQVRETRLRGPDGALVVWQWYWIDGGFTANDYLGKLLQAKERLLMRGDDGAGIMVYARFDENPDTARAALRSFLAAQLPAMESALAANRRH
nr:exosortase A [uncultured Noviherbaspirillum sp.]